jgi:hypothetical protein
MRMLIQQDTGFGDQVSQQVVCGALFAAAVNSTTAGGLPLPASVLHVDLEKIQSRDARELVKGALLYACIQHGQWAGVLQLMRQLDVGYLGGAEAALAACDECNLALMQACNLTTTLLWVYGASPLAAPLAQQHMAVWLAEAAGGKRQLTTSSAESWTLDEQKALLETARAMCSAQEDPNSRIAELVSIAGSVPCPLVQASLALAASALGDTQGTSEWRSTICSHAMETALLKLQPVAVDALCAAMRTMGVSPDADVSAWAAEVLADADFYDTSRWALANSKQPHTGSEYASLTSSRAAPCGGDLNGGGLALLESDLEW